MTSDTSQLCCGVVHLYLCVKAEYPVPCTGMNGQWVFGGVSPQAYEAFSKEEAPPCGRGFFTETDKELKIKKPHGDSIPLRRLYDQYLLEALCIAPSRRLMVCDKIRLIIVVFKTIR